MKKLLLFLISLSTFICKAQDTQQLNQTLEYLLENRIDSAYNEIKNTPNTVEKNALLWHLDAFYYGIKDSIVVSKNDDSISFVNILNLLKQGEIYEEPVFNKDTLAFERYRSALDLSLKKNDSLLIRFTLNKLLKFTFNNPRLFSILDEYAEVYKTYSSSLFDEVTYNYYKYSAIAYLNNKHCIEIYEIDLIKIKDTENYYLIGFLNQMLGAQESYFNNDFDKGIIYFKKAADAYSKISGIKGEEQMFGIYNNIAAAYNFKNKPEIALQYFDKAKKCNIPENSFFQKSYNYQAIAQTHQRLKNHDSAYYYLEKEKEVTKRFNEYKIAIGILETETKYQTVEKEKQILIEQQQKKKNKNIAFALGALLLFVAITAFLIQKNTKRKQLLAEQEKQLETQKLTTVLKEQELNAIDAMIEGQEKERQRIANDLHDDLGGLMATVKFHFNALQDEQSPELFKKTNQLLDQAYNKIRTVAHTKNSGVMAKQGLLKAVQNMVENISASNKIAIEVLDHGLENRLENSLELTLFRIIQELVTNIIKHAEASEVTIHLTNHEDSLNILVEDNGKGFNPSQVTTKNKGMGISSIDKRIEHLNGTMTIESEINKGTTIIIDIPL